MNIKLPKWLNPTKQLALILVILSGLAIGFNPRVEVLYHLLATLGFSLTLFWFYTLVSSKKKNVWNTVITALIIFLVLDYATVDNVLLNLSYSLIASFIAITQKFFVELKRSPIINPAVTGLLLMAGIVAFIPGLEDPFISWWGASIRGWVSMLVLAVWVLFGLGKWNKWPMFVAFCLVHALTLLARGEGMEFLQYTFSDSTVYFMAGIMLTEPLTSPVKKSQQIVYGGAAALAFNILLHFVAPYANLFALAFADLGWMLKRYMPKR